MLRLGLTIAAALLLAMGTWACGGDDSSDPPDATATTTGTATDSTTGTTETADEPASLPKGWSEEINQQAGFSIGLPPDWSIRRTQGGQGSILTSPDELIAVSVTADRTQGALDLPLDDFAIRTAEALGSEVVGTERLMDLQVGIAAPFAHTYDAVGVRAFGTGKSGVREAILVVVARREGQAAYVIIDRENADKPSKLADRDTVKKIVRSLRGRPPA